MKEQLSVKLRDTLSSCFEIVDKTKMEDYTYVTLKFVPPDGVMGDGSFKVTLIERDLTAIFGEPGFVA